MTQRLNNPQTDGYDAQQATLGPYPGGMNNIDPVTDLPDGQLREQRNVDATRTATLRRRAGYKKVMDLGQGHSLYSDGLQLLTVEDGRLVRLHPDTSSSRPQLFDPETTAGWPH